MMDQGGLMFFRILLPVLLLAGSLADPAGSRAGDTLASLTGHVMYRERMAMPPASIVTVTLADVSRADARATVLAEQRIEGAASIPIPFQLDYDPGDIDNRMSYAIQAQIRDASGDLLWTTTEHRGVLTRGNPFNDIEVWVQRVDSQ
jgi:putative lipoprotein